jgi:hypothetical protein
MRLGLRARVVNKESIDDERKTPTVSGAMERHL